MSWKFWKGKSLPKLDEERVGQGKVLYKGEKDRVCYSTEFGEFWGIVYERKKGGFDLYLLWEMCEDLNLEEHQIERLKSRCDKDGEAFVALMPQYNERAAVEALKRWVHAQLSIPLN